MSLVKAIEHGKERRKAYKGSKAFDKSCRNHGGCDWCRMNRLVRARREDLRTIYALNDVITQ